MSRDRRHSSLWWLQQESFRRRCYLELGVADLKLPKKAKCGCCRTRSISRVRSMWSFLRLPFGILGCLEKFSNCMTDW
ncbi:unnamed protein product [Prunus armeniaca]|uniref:Uncharacterized protein n=1 Tax=Prunus armeniaca TaxID=36596 RepID=A0A6J5U409_PRUAR|nr:unnamed protein product [Prunus armeniaca]